MKHDTVRGQIIQLLRFFTYPSYANIFRTNTVNENIQKIVGTCADLQAMQGFGGLIRTKIIKFDQFLAEKQDTKFQQNPLNSS